MKKPEISKQPPIKLYTSITDLPLRNFIEVLVDGNYARLIRSGYPGEIEIKEAWTKIMAEYSDQEGTHENKLWLNLMKDVAILETTLVQINTLVEILQQVYYEPFCQRLNSLLYTSFTFNPDQPEEYQKLLKGCLNRSKSLKIDLDLKRLNITAIEEKAQNEGAPYTREYFQSILITVSDHAKYHITDSITVFEFCERIKRFNNYCEQVKQTLKP